MCLIWLVLHAAVAMVGADFYSSRYDDFDVQPLIENDRILMAYTNCFLEQGPCTPDAKDFKKVIPETLQTCCGSCTPKQKDLIRKVINAVMTRHPKAWQEILDRYDKELKYRDPFNKFLQESK